MAPLCAQPTPPAQAVVVGGSLPPAGPDLHCAARTGCTLGKGGGIVAPVEIVVSTPCLSIASRNNSGLLHTTHN